MKDTNWSLELARDGRADIAKGLRRAADRLEELSKTLNRRADFMDRTDRPDAVVSDVLHDIMWGIANMSLDQLVSIAGEVVKQEALAKTKEV